MISLISKKAMATVFWDVRGKMDIEQFQKGRKK